MVDTKLIAKTKAEPQNQLKTPVSTSITNSAVGKATRYGDWTVRGFSVTCPDRPWGPPGILYNGYLVFPGGKEAGAWR
jgi:hypothetical protein